MAAELLELEGTWEEILARSRELEGRRVRLTVLSEAGGSPSGAAPDFTERMAGGARRRVTPAELRRAAETARDYYASDPEALELADFVGDDHDA
jgi:hypothetical protein